MHRRPWKVKLLGVALLVTPIFFLPSIPSYAESDVYGGDDYQKPPPEDENQYQKHRRLRRQRRQRLSRMRRQVNVGGDYGMAGCGLGATFFHAEPGGVQIVAATSNQSFGNQTFAISSGTSECGKGKREEWIEAYLHVNGPKLITQAAQGQGEAWDTLPGLTGCSPLTAVNAVIQTNWHTIETLPTPQGKANRILGLLRRSPGVQCES